MTPRREEPFVSTPLAYERDPHRRSLATKILRAGADAHGAFVVLADTILYPEGGGQPADHGRVNGVPVEDVQWVAGEPRHYVASAIPPGPADVELDWERRFDHMQQHTAQHLLTALAQDRFHWATTAFHLGAKTSDIELDVRRLPPAALDALEDAAAAEIRTGRPVSARRVAAAEFASLSVRTRGLPEDLRGDIRLVEIAGLDLNTCGGAHVDNTAAIETVKLLRAEPMRGGARVHFVAGGRVRRLCGEHETRNDALRRLLGAGDDELIRVATLKLGQLQAAEKRIRGLERSVARQEAERVARSGEAVAAAHWDDVDAAFLRRVARDLDRLGARGIVLLTAGAGPEGAFLLRGAPDSTVDFARLAQGVAAMLEGRGGGAGLLFQGKAEAISKRGQALAWLREQAGR